MTKKTKHIHTIIEVTVLLIVPIIMALCVLLHIQASAAITLLVAIAALVIFFISYEKSRPALHQIMPTVILAALAVAGRIIFYYLPYIKPVSAICIIAGAVFGKKSGFMVGSLAALVSNIYFGQGPWTAWHMYSWGLVGYLAGVLGEHLDLFNPFKTRKCTATDKDNGEHGVRQEHACQNNAFQQGIYQNNTSQRGVRQKSDHKQGVRPLIYVYGFLSALLYGFILNSYYVIGFVQPLTLESALLAYGAGLPFDLLHGASTVGFLIVLYAPWIKKLKRIKEKYAS